MIIFGLTVGDSGLGEILVADGPLSGDFINTVLFLWYSLPLSVRILKDLSVPACSVTTPGF